MTSLKKVVYEVVQNANGLQHKDIVLEVLRQGCDNDTISQRVHKVLSELLRLGAISRHEEDISLSRTYTGKKYISGPCYRELQPVMETNTDDSDYVESESSVSLAVAVAVAPAA